MCKFGDVIVVKKYIGDDGEIVNQHSFIVIDDNPGEIKSLRYDLVTNVMSSFKSEAHRKKKMKFAENLEIESEDIISESKNLKTGYIKADQLYYFEKKNIDYYVFARIDPELLDELIRLVIEISVADKLKINTKNLTKVEA